MAYLTHNKLVENLKGLKEDIERQLPENCSYIILAGSGSNQEERTAAYLTNGSPAEAFMLTADFMQMLQKVFRNQINEDSEERD